MSLPYPRVFTARKSIYTHLKIWQRGAVHARATPAYAQKPGCKWGKSEEFDTPAVFTRGTRERARRNDVILSLVKQTRQYAEDVDPNNDRLLRFLLLLEEVSKIYEPFITP